MIRQYTDLTHRSWLWDLEPEQAAIVAKIAEAVVVGSAIVDLIGKVGDSDVLADRVAKFVTPIVSAMRKTHKAR